MHIRYMITIEKKMLKKKMLEACITRHESLIDDYKTRIKSLLDNSGLGNEEEYDNTELSQKSQSADEINSINKELELANIEMIVLESLQAVVDETKLIVSPGAVVVTDRETFFVSVSNVSKPGCVNRWYNVLIKIESCG